MPKLTEKVGELSRVTEFDTVEELVAYEVQIQTERDPRAESAIKTLDLMGYKWRGGQLWAPPKGPKPAFN